MKAVGNFLRRERCDVYSRPINVGTNAEIVR